MATFNPVSRHDLSARLLAMAALALLIPVGELHAQFHDQGLQYARIRTDYNATNEGTAANPITLVSPCLYPPDDQPNPPDNQPPPPSPGPDGIFLVDNQCNTAPTVYPQSNYFHQNGGGSSSTFWVLSMNNEPWEGAYNSGPPNQSLPRVFPGTGIMGFTAIIDYAAGESFWRLHKVLNNAFPNPDPGIPFLAVGAADNRGNGGQVGTFNVSGQPHVVTFTDKLWDYNQGTGSGWVLSHFLFATAEWGGKTRMLFIHLFYDGVVPDKQGNPVSWYGWSDIDETGSGSAGGGRGWNWQMQESLWHPGANIVFMDAAAMNLPQVCNMNIPVFQYIGQEINYLINLEQAFRCASNLGYFQTPMPAFIPVPLTGVFWGVELAGVNAGIWTSVHNMRMLQLPPLPYAQPLSAQALAVGARRPPSAVLPADLETYRSSHGNVARIRTAFEASCAAAEGCAEANVWSVPGAAIPEPAPGGRAGTIRDLIDTADLTSHAGD